MSTGFALLNRNCSANEIELRREFYDRATVPRE